MTSETFPKRRLAALAAAGSLMALPALAQDFNDAPPHGEGQTPAFEGQTRAPVLPAADLTVTPVVEGLEHPWAMAELPDGSWLVTERPGRLRLVGADGALSDPIEGLPEVDNRGQGGLLDVVVADDFADTRRVWWSFAEPRGDNKNATAVATGTLSEDGTAIEDARVIWQQEPAWESDKHFGSILVFDNDGGLFVTTGERSDADVRVFSQDVTTSLGKVIRINPEDGSPMGQPGNDEALPEIWSWGHRNIQGADIDADGVLWTIEHGPKGGDELNRPEPGLNYGWPEVTYGIEYSGQIVGEGITQKEGTEQPIYYWDPVIGPGDMVFYDGEMFPDWQGDILIAGLVSEGLVRLELADGLVSGEARQPLEIGRIRDVDIASDGALMVVTDEADGGLYRITPAQ